jgi:hypothetical protein
MPESVNELLTLNRAALFAQTHPIIHSVREGSTTFFSTQVHTVQLAHRSGAAL